MIEHDRTAQLVMASDSAVDYQTARARLDSTALRISIAEDALCTAWGEAALVALVACGSRMFARGVYLAIDPEHSSLLSLYRNRTLLRLLRSIGARTEDVPHTTFHVHVGCSAQADLLCWTDGWTAHVAPKAKDIPAQTGNELSGTFAGALAVATAFRARVLGDVLAQHLPQSFSLWPGAPANTIDYLPNALWCIGLGNLGQAGLLALSLLPYRDASTVTLLLQDPDSVGPENIPVQILTQHAWVGQKKARAVADWANRIGFATVTTERLFQQGDGPRGEEPNIALVGVDNLEARHAVAAGGFALAVDAGLGATGPEAFDLRVHCFPGERTPDQAWPALGQNPVAPTLTAALEALVKTGKLTQCGAMTIAGKAVGVPCTAVAAAAIQLTQIVRAIATGIYCDRVDLSLTDCRRGASHDHSAAIVTPYQRALS